MTYKFRPRKKANRRFLFIKYEELLYFCLCMYNTGDINNNICVVRSFHSIQTFLLLTDIVWLVQKIHLLQQLRTGCHFY